MLEETECRRELWALLVGLAGGKSLRVLLQFTGSTLCLGGTGLFEVQLEPRGSARAGHKHSPWGCSCWEGPGEAPGCTALCFACCREYWEAWPRLSHSLQHVLLALQELARRVSCLSNTPTPETPAQGSTLHPSKLDRGQEVPSGLLPRCLSTSSSTATALPWLGGGHWPFQPWLFPLQCQLFPSSTPAVRRGFVQLGRSESAACSRASAHTPLANGVVAWGSLLPALPDCLLT